MTRTHKLFTTVLGLGLLCGTAPVALAQPAAEPPVKAAKPEAKAPAPENRARALAVVDRFVEAIGGAEELNKKRSMRTVGTISLMGMTGELEVRLIPGKGMLQHMVILGPDKSPIMESSTGSDGEHGWTFDSMSGAQLLPDSMHEQLRRESDPSSVMRYDEIYPVIEYMGEREFDGTPVETIRIVDESGLESIQHYSKETGLLIGGEGDQDSPQGQMRVQSKMEVYKDFDGIKIATRTTMVMGPMTMQMTIGTVEIGQVQPEDLEPPMPVQKLLEKVAQKEAEKAKKAGDEEENDGEG